jgi:hypothetical protein
MFETHSSRKDERSARLCHRLHRISSEIQECLLEACWVRLDLWKRRIVDTLDFDALMALLELE